MAGRHRRRRTAVLRRETPVLAAPPALTIEMTDGHTRLTHQVNDGAFTLGRPVGRYRAMCGALVLVASLAAPGAGRCPMCEKWAVS